MGFITYLTYKIFTRSKQLKKAGLAFKHPILKVYYFSVAQLVLWTLNGIVKALDAAD
jgi:hypothetical protein